MNVARGDKVEELPRILRSARRPACQRASQLLPLPCSPSSRSTSTTRLEFRRRRDGVADVGFALKRPFTSWSDANQLT
jgi:hypothetical protein